MKVVHKTMNTISGLNRILSANAPMIRAGVMAANFNWNAMYNSAGIVAE
jgi:hypothetical protein